MRVEDVLLSAYIAKLQALLAEHGDLPVQKYLISKGRHAAPDPVLAYARVYDRKNGGVGIAPQFYQPVHDTPVQKGEPVIRI